jgi:hypothetical protein
MSNLLRVKIKINLRYLPVVINHTNTHKLVIKSQEIMNFRIN